jgi:YggT family protein
MISLLALAVAAIRICMLAVLVRAILSWLPYGQRENDLTLFLVKITEPVLAPVRRVVPASWGLDFSPLLVILAGELLVRILTQTFR